MKKAISIILSVFLALSVAGCGQTVQRAEAPAEQDAQKDIVVNRTEQTSVYQTESPAGMDNIVLSTQVQTADAEGYAAESPAPGTQADAQTIATKTKVQEIRAVWLTYINMDQMINGKTKAQFTANMDAAFRQIAEFGFNTVFAQVRPFGDALYNSKYYPWSYTLTGTEGKNPGFDPLEIMCSLADKHSLRIEAWINPYRVRANNNGKALSSDNQARKWIASGNDGALEWNGGVFYNPGSASARKLIINGVKEIVSGYDVDGIHFDDYFYPTTDMKFDAATYQASGSKLSQADWRRENVNTLVREVYAAVKAIKPSVQFGISPQGNMKNNYDGQFADCAKWLANPGYVDYICPQVYYGFENGTNPYSKTVSDWNKLIRADGVSLYVGIAAYKLGQADQWAGAGAQEWVKTDGILADMVSDARSASNYGGVCLYSFDSLFNTNTAQVRMEKEKLKEMF